MVEAGSTGERGTYHRPPKLDKAGASPPRGEAFRRGVWVPVRLHGFSFFARFPTSNRAPLEAMREAHVPAQQPETQEDARVPAPDAHSGGSRGAEGTAEPRPQAPLRLIWRVRDRATFDALARVPALRRGPLWLRSAPVGPDDTPPRVAYAVGRAVGPAVRRNRLRRRLREALRAGAGELRPGYAYLVGARPEAVTMPYRELVTTLEGLLRKARETR